MNAFLLGFLVVVLLAGAFWGALLFAVVRNGVSRLFSLCHFQEGGSI